MQSFSTTHLAAVSLLLATAVLATSAVGVYAGDAAASLRVVSDDEPGKALEVRGTVFDRSTRRPVAGAVIEVYQTDDNGLYGRDGGSEARIRGVLVTDSDGRFSLSTIRPGSYPGGGVPQHIHYTVSAPRYRSIRGEILFDDDPLLTESARRSAASNDNVVATLRASGGGVACEIELPLPPHE